MRNTVKRGGMQGMDPLMRPREGFMAAPTQTHTRRGVEQRVATENPNQDLHTQGIRQNQELEKASREKRANKDKAMVEIWNNKRHEAIQNPVWKLDDECTICSSPYCPYEFKTGWMSKRGEKHHCRRCGYIYCGKCCKHEFPLNRWVGENGVVTRDKPKKQKVCDFCLPELLEEDSL